MSAETDPLVEVSRYTVSAVSREVEDWSMFALTVERTAPDRWAVRRGQRCLNAYGMDVDTLPPTQYRIVKSEQTGE
jgi:hypothetical protein